MDGDSHKISSHAFNTCSVILYVWTHFIFPKWSHKYFFSLRLIQHWYFSMVTWCLQSLPQLSRLYRNNAERLLKLNCNRWWGFCLTLSVSLLVKSSTDRPEPSSLSPHCRFVQIKCCFKQPTLGVVCYMLWIEIARKTKTATYANHSTRSIDRLQFQFMESQNVADPVTNILGYL